MPKAESRSHTVHGASNFAALFGKEEESKPKTAPLQLPGLLGGRTLHFIRHCQGEHNATQAAGGTSQYLLDDAVLSSAGEAVARQLLSNPMFSTETGEQQLPELVVVSPLRRTIQTAVLGFGTDASFVLRPELQESSPMPCDCAKPELGVELLRRLGCDALRDEYEALPKDWHVKGAKWKATVLERFATLLKWLETRPERRIAIVGASRLVSSNPRPAPPPPRDPCGPRHTPAEVDSSPQVTTTSCAATWASRLRMARCARMSSRAACFSGRAKRPRRAPRWGCASPASTARPPPRRAPRASTSPPSIERRGRSASRSRAGALCRRRALPPSTRRAPRPPRRATPPRTTLPASSRAPCRSARRPGPRCA